MVINKRYYLVLPIIAGAFFLLYDLAGNPIWSDEYFTYTVIFQGGFPSRVLADIHPPLYYLLVLGFSRIVPAGLLALRLFSVICGGLAVYLSYILCRRYFSTAAATILLILMPINCHLILFSKMARYYIPLMLFVLLAQLAFDRMLSHRKAPDIILYAVALAACFYINLVSLLLIPAHLTAAVLRRKGVLQTIAGHVISVVLLIPWIPVVINQLGSKGGLAPFGNEVPLSPIGFIARILWPLYDFSFGENIPPWDWALTIPGIIAVLAAAAWFLAGRARRGEFAGYILWLLVPLAVVTGAILPVGIEFLPPRASFILPFWLMIIAAGISRMPRQLLPIPIIILVGVSLVGNIRYLRHEDTLHSTYIIPWEEIARTADELAGEDGIIVSDDESIRYYMPDDKRLMFLSVLKPEDVIKAGKPVVLVVNPRDITPGGRLAPFLDALNRAGYRELDRIEFLKENEKTRAAKQKLLRREVSRAKKEVRLYKPVGGARE